MMNHLPFRYRIDLSFDQPVWEHYFLLRCIPAAAPTQTIVNLQLTLSEGARWTCQTDGLGNYIQPGSFISPHTEFFYEVSGIAVVDSEPGVYPQWVNPVFTMPSKYTVPDSAMLQIARSFTSVGEFDLCEEICEAVHGRMVYTPGSTGIHTTARDVFYSGKGVCQDYSHLFLSFARARGLRARYVNGIHEGSDSSHAWCEVFLNGAWRGIDPTWNKWVNNTYIRFNSGRDFSDCPIEKGVFRGPANQTQSILVRCGNP